MLVRHVCLIWNASVAVSKNFNGEHFKTMYKDCIIKLARQQWNKQKEVDSEGRKLRIWNVIYDRVKKYFLNLGLLTKPKSLPLLRIKLQK
jgi:hypothetical protein